LAVNRHRSESSCRTAFAFSRFVSGKDMMAVIAAAKSTFSGLAAPFAAPRVNSCGFSPKTGWVFWACIAH
jgi:hypothetical protein